MTHEQCLGIAPANRAEYRPYALLLISDGVDVLGRGWRRQGPAEDTFEALTTTMTTQLVEGVTDRRAIDPADPALGVVAVRGRMPPPLQEDVDGQ
jgi:hypothetical protein